MFATANSFFPQYSDCMMNKPSADFFTFQNNKENYNPFSQNKPQHQRAYSRMDYNPFTSQPLRQIHPSGQVQFATQKECSAMFTGGFVKKNTSLQVRENKCLHQSPKKYQRTFCKDCGIFIPEVSYSV